MKFIAIPSLFIPMALSLAVAAEIKPQVLDASHSPAGNFLAYTEFELSGEPLAESLGLDLDILDANALHQPTAFDYAAGIESYEYSEEAMYALNYQSQMGPHLINGPRNSERQGSNALTQRIEALAQAVGFPKNEIPANLYPISLPYQKGLPSLVLGDVATSEGELIATINAQGEEGERRTRINAYRSDYKSLVWSQDSFDKTLNPAAIGGILLKEVMWSQDFLGGMHEVETDAEVEAESAKMDQDGVHRLGVSAADGFQGMLLTEISLDKMRLLQERLGFDGKKLGAAITPSYDPVKQPLWFAHQVAVDEVQRNGVNALGALRVTDGRSTLRDTWMLLWPLAEFFAFSDQREANSGQNPAFSAVFDGAPFAAAPASNRDSNTANDQVGTDAFSLAANLSNLMFKNLDALHFDPKRGTLVDDFQPGTAATGVTLFDAAYALVALSIYQRAQDALPVGYASADGGAVDLQTAAGKRALALIRAQADFILQQAVSENGLVVDHIQFGDQSAPNFSLATQFAAIRGLVAAGLATQDQRYRQQAKRIYLAVEKNLYDANLGTWSDKPGADAILTPWQAAAVSGGLRSVMLHLANQEGEHEPALELSHLAQRYVQWFKVTINAGLQLAEPDGDTGENRLADASVTDSDGDGVRSIIGAGYAPVLAERVKLSVR